MGNQVWPLKKKDAWRLEADPSLLGSLYEFLTANLLLNLAGE